MPIHILAIDTTSEICSVALNFNGDILLDNFTIAPHKHTQQILPMVDKLLIKTDTNLKNLDAIAFGRGPGSFTGIRIGISIAQGLALGANLPVIGVSTLAILAESAWRKTGISQVLTAIDAQMGEVYWAPYQRKTDGWKGSKFETITTPEKLKSISKNFSGSWATAGNGWLIYPTLFHHHKLTLIDGTAVLPNAKDMLLLALQYYLHGDAKPVTFAKPIYLRKKIAQKKY